MSQRRRRSAHKRAISQKNSCYWQWQTEKINMELWDTDSSYGLWNFDYENDSSDPDIY